MGRGRRVQRRALIGLLGFTCALVVGVTSCRSPARDTLVLSGRSSNVRGGEPVLGTGHEELCAAAIAAIVDGDTMAPYLADLLVIGPGFAHAMAGDQTKFPYGKAMLLTGNFGGRQVFFLSRGVMVDEAVTLFKSPEVRVFLRGFKDQKAEPATRHDRELYYSLIAWEIAGEPVTIIRDGSRRLLLQATKEGKLHWIDRIDQYPVPSVAGSVDEAVKVMHAVNRGRH